MPSALDELCINTIRTLSIDGVQKAKSGHPGLPLGCAVMAYVVWTRHLRHDPANPKWENRDRFVLSAGHGSMLLYSMLHLTGYDLPLEQLQQFRQWGSRTPGHPENALTPGVEATTGPLGQGVGNIVGMAIAREHLAAKFNAERRQLIDFRVFGICSDGDLMEGVSAEAASLAGHLGLGAITLLYDDNKITIDGSTQIAFTENVAQRFEAFGWHVIECDGLDLDAVDKAIAAGTAMTDKPTLVRCRTTIGFGSPNKAGTAKAHGAPLGEEEVILTKRNLGWPEDKSFFIPNEALKQFRAAIKQGCEAHSAWSKVRDEALRDSAFAARWNSFWGRRFPDGWEAKLPNWSEADKPMATRKASELCMKSLAPLVPNLIGGSADLVESNLTYLDEQGDFQKDNRSGSNLRFGIREHGMGAILNGIALAAPYVPFGATFLCFLDYMKPSVRLSALSDLPVIYIYTHDSIGLGEDGPTHQPIEHLWHMRATPNLVVFRPADANETAQCWKLAIERTHGPSALVLTRQNLPVLDPGRATKDAVDRGGYILAEASGSPPQVILIASGSEVSLAMKARARLETEGVSTRVVSMPCVELFDQQSTQYREQVLPRAVRVRVCIEAGAPTGWWKYAGDLGNVIGLERFGVSAPGEIAMEKLGFNVDHVCEQVHASLRRVVGEDAGVAQ